MKDVQIIAIKLKAQETIEAYHRQLEAGADPRAAAEAMEVSVRELHDALRPRMEGLLPSFQLGLLRMRIESGRPAAVEESFYKMDRWMRLNIPGSSGKEAIV